MFAGLERALTHTLWLMFGLLRAFLFVLFHLFYCGSQLFPKVRFPFLSFLWKTTTLLFDRLPLRFFAFALIPPLNARPSCYTPLACVVFVPTFFATSRVLTSIGRFIFLIGREVVCVGYAGDGEFCSSPGEVGSPSTTSARSPSPYRSVTPLFRVPRSDSNLSNGSDTNSDLGSFAFVSFRCRLVT